MTPHLNVSGVISKVFDLYGKHLGTLLAIGAAILIPFGIVEGLLSESGVFLRLIGMLAGLVGTYLFTGSIVRFVQDAESGQISSVGQIVGSVGPVLVTLIVVGILAAIGITIGFFLILLPGIFLLTIWSVIAPVVVVEKASILHAFSRSWELTKGNFWQVLGVVVLFWLIQVAAVIVLVVILTAISDTVILAIVAALVGRLLLAPLEALAHTVMYFELAGTGTIGPPPTYAAPTPPPPAPPAV
jgi:hypothetical protein